jgi:predicted RNase H-like HicB family nuclease
VVYEWAGKNFSGYAPDIEGCAATAKTLPKIRVTLRSALEAHLQWLQEDGDPIPGYYVIIEKINISMPKRKRASTRKSSMRELSAA